MRTYLSAARVAGEIQKLFYDLLVAADGEAVPAGKTQNPRNGALPKKSSAMPSDVRKAFGLPGSRHFDFRATPNLLGRSP